MTDITEILDTNAKSNWAIAYEHDVWIENASAEIKRLRRDLSNSDYELNKALTEIDRLKAEVNQYENIIIPSWKREERIWREFESEYSDKVEKLQKQACQFRFDLLGAVADQARLVGANLSYMERIERHEKAAEKALDWIESADHKPGCPRIRDDYDCTCGRDEVIQALYGVFEGGRNERQHDQLSSSWRERLAW